MIILRLSLMFLIIFFCISCSKPCDYKKLPKEELNDGFTKVEENNEINVVDLTFLYSGNQIPDLTCFKSQQEIDSIIGFGFSINNIDFSNSQLLLLTLFSESGTDGKSNVYIGNSGNNYRLYIDYTMKDHCSQADSDVNGLMAYCYAIIPSSVVIEELSQEIRFFD